jgi:hypothetical protein
VRCRGAYGWVRPAGVPLDDQVLQTIAGGPAIHPEKFTEKVRAQPTRPPVLEITVSPANTPDDLHFLRRAELAMKRASLGDALFIERVANDRPRPLPDPLRAGARRHGCARPRRGDEGLVAAGARRETGRSGCSSPPM